MLRQFVVLSLKRIHDATMQVTLFALASLWMTRKQLNIVGEVRF